MIFSVLAQAEALSRGIKSGCPSPRDFRKGGNLCSWSGQRTFM